MGTPEYRELYSSIYTGKGSYYETLFNVTSRIRDYNNVYDVYLGMLDPEMSRMVYVVDPDRRVETRYMPGDWEEVHKIIVDVFTSEDTTGPLYVFDRTSQYGLMCAVGRPIMDSNGRVCCYMMMDIATNNILRGMAGFSIRLIIVMVLMSVLLAWIQTRRINKYLVSPINRIAEASINYVRESRKENPGKEYFAALNINSGDEIEKLCRNLAQMEKELADYEADLTKITAEKQRIVTELSLATKIQASMLPDVFPAFPDRHEFDIYAKMIPAREVSGDFYDFFLVDDDHLCLVMADVAGKGIPAALFMMISKTILQSCVMLGVSAAECLYKMNTGICANNKTDMFVTVWLGILEISTGRMTCSNAGHEYPVLKRADGKFELFKEMHGVMIGGIPGSEYTEYTVELHPGDCVFVYTDGIPDATRKDEEMYGLDRMIDALNKVTKVEPKEVLDSLLGDVYSFVDEAEQYDDMTMLCMQYKGV